MNEFYKAGECNGLISAEIQLKNKEEWKNKAKLEYWKSVKEAMIDKINQLWRLKTVDFLEDEWFTGYEHFLKDIQAAGYHVYVGEPVSVQSNDGSLAQLLFIRKRFIISLDDISDSSEVKEVWDGDKDA